MNEFPIGGTAPSATAEVAPAVRVLRWMAGILQLAAIALVIAPWLATGVTRQFGFEDPLPEGWIRFGGVVLFLLTAVFRLLLPGGRRRNRTEGAFSAVAGATGGTFQVEKRRLPP